jgi:alcohol dehydrogenase (quinone), cytochrome c subunit
MEPMKLCRQLVGALALAGLLLGEPAVSDPNVAPMQDPLPPAQRGQYLADAGDCVSCHTQPGAQPFSGGVAFDTPFGRLYSSNITPDRATGIGTWSAADFRRAMQSGVAANGDHLFPAFPYTSFTKVSDADVAALYAFLRTVKAATYSPPKNDVLLSQRWALGLWNSLFFEEGRFSPNAAKSGEWNRGAYLVEGLGHCSACHTPRNPLMAESAGKAYAGGTLKERVSGSKNRDWSAVNLTSAKGGLAAWSVEDLAKYLATGFSRRAGTFGPMNDVIVNSLKKLSADDVHAMAVYLKSLPAQDTAESVTPEQVSAGASIYKDRCEKCHGSSGRGGLFSGPALAGSAVAQASDPASLINVIVYGPETPKDVSFGGWETMKPYADVLDDSQVAAVSNYVRGSWGNVGGPVSAEQVTRQR